MDLIIVAIIIIPVALFVKLFRYIMHYNDPINNFSGKTYMQRGAKTAYAAYQKRNDKREAKIRRRCAKERERMEKAYNRTAAGKR